MTTSCPLSRGTTRVPSGPRRETESRMPTFELHQPDGTPATPATFVTNASSWKVGDVIPLGAGKALRVVAVHAAEPVLVVEDAAA
jgi:hypothetical protein